MSLPKGAEELENSKCAVNFAKIQMIIAECLEIT